MIEFVEGEKFCRWNGTLMSEKNYKKLFGIDGEPDVADDLICYDGIFYTDLSFGDLVIRLAEWYGEKHGKVEEYDDVLSKGGGWSGYCVEKTLENKLIIPIDVVEGMEMKPLAAFRKKYPKFDQEKFFAFQDELEEYYDKLYNKR